MIKLMRSGSKTKALLGFSGLCLFSFSIAGIAAVPTVPKLKSPANAATVSCANATFSWSASAGATSYNILFSSQDPLLAGLKNNGSCDSTCTIIKGVNTTTLSKSMSSCNTTYYWKVQGVNAKGEGGGWSSSPAWTLKTDGGNPQVDWSLNAYRKDNSFFPVFAPNSVGGTITYNNGKYAKGNCTWYVQGRLLQLGYDPKQLKKMIRSAKYWDDDAKKAKIQVDNTPTAGAIAQTDKGGGGLGHVAVVEKTNPDGTIYISESSYSPTPGTNYDFKYSTRTVKNTAFENYIHVAKAK